MAERIKKIYGLLAKLSVAGDAVDIMARVREELRVMYAEAQEKEGKTDGAA